MPRNITLLAGILLLIGQVVDARPCQLYNAAQLVVRDRSLALKSRSDDWRPSAGRISKYSSIGNALNPIASLAPSQRPQNQGNNAQSSVESIDSRCSLCATEKNYQARNFSSR
ncbi:hypothetical protein C8J56DRAFT_1056895 [Mycena floridula]|nr:hypothetical protein C8J56DRAFT_1056895 [Mycena floridula]